MSAANLLAVGAGGFMGAIARYALGAFIGRRYPAWGFPLGTFLINVSGSFLISFCMVLMAERALADPRLRLLVTVGFLGSFTTFSTFQYETGALIRDNQWAMAGANVIGSVLAGFLALKLGEALARAL